MSTKIWITKDWENSSTITIWTEKPVWYPNKKHKQPHDNGFWYLRGEDRFSHSSCIFHDSLSRFFKVAFTKKKNEGYIAERILSINLPKK